MNLSVTMGLNLAILPTLKTKKNIAILNLIKISKFRFRLNNGEIVSYDKKTRKVKYLQIFT